MQFLFPNVLWGLLALAVPVIVHLFNFRKTKRIYFSNVALLKGVETKTSSARKLKNLLILFARMLFLAALVLAFAQPVKRSAENLGQPVGINGIYLDNSQSMQNLSDNGKLLDLAIVKIDELLTLLNKTSNLQLTTNDFDGEDQFVGTASKVKDRLTTVTYSETGRDLNLVYKRQESVARKYNPSGRNHLFWLSDFQKSTAGNLSEIKVDSNDMLHLIPIVGKEVQNVFVDSVWLNVPFVRELQNNSLHFKVYNSGKKAVEKLPLKLFIDDVQISTSSVDLAPNSFTAGKFNFTVSTKGVHKGKITLDDQPISFDNDYYFTLEASPAIRILHLYDQQSTPDYIAKLFSNDSLFNYRSFSINNFNIGEIQNTDLLLLEGIATIEGEKKAAIDNFLKQGGNVAILPSANVSQVSLGNFLAGYGIQNLQVDNYLPKNEAFEEIVAPNRLSPFYADVFEDNSRNGTQSVPSVYPKIKWSFVGEPILSLKSGKPFLSRTRISEGNLYLFASPLSKAFGNFGEHALFVPTLIKMAYLSTKADRLAYNFSEGFIQLYMPNAPKNALYKLKNKNIELIPTQNLKGKVLTLTLPKSSELQENQLLSAGVFDLEINGKVEKQLAINHNKNESFLDTYSSSELKAAFESQKKNVRIYDALEDSQFIEAFRSTLADKVYWKYFIVAALVFLLSEILITRFLKG